MAWFNNSGSNTIDELFIFGNYPATGRHEIGWLTKLSTDGFGYSNSEYQDPSAWYHVVLRSTSTTNIELYVNGQQITDWRTQKTHRHKTNSIKIVPALLVQELQLAW